MNRRNFHVFGIAIVSMLHSYFSQRRTIGSFTATAAVLVHSAYKLCVDSTKSFRVKLLQCSVCLQSHCHTQDLSLRHG